MQSSVSQSSVIGIIKPEAMVLRQGVVQPLNIDFTPARTDTSHIDIKLFPNPVNDFIFFKSNKEMLEPMNLDLFSMYILDLLRLFISTIQ